MLFKHSGPAVLVAAMLACIGAPSLARAQALAHVASLAVSHFYLPASVALDDAADVRPNDGAEPRFGLTLYSGPFSAAGLTAPQNDQASKPEQRRPSMPGLAAPSGMFGGVEVRIGRTVHAQTWNRLLDEKAARYFADDCNGPRAVCDAPARRRIVDAAQSAVTEAPRRAIQRINEAVNRAIRFTPDLDQYGASDHWASAAQTLRSGRGDCEDYAILKYWALAAIGVPPEAMRLVLVRDVRRRLDHAVLVLAVNGENLVLDSLSNEVKTDAAFRQYEPRLSLAADGSWLHGRFRPQIARADIGPATSGR